MNTDMTIYESILPFKDSNNIALYFRNKKVTHKEFLNLVDKQAEKLVELGIRYDDVVALLSPNIIECIVTYYALNKIGAIVSFLHPLLPPKVLEESLNETQAKFFIVIDVFYKKYQEVIEKTNIKTFLITALTALNPIESIVFKKQNKDALDGLDDKMYIYKYELKGKVKIIPNNNFYKPSVYLRSGGTTGKSKTVVLNDKQLLYPGSLATWITGQELAGKAIIGVLPLFHGFGLAMGVIAPLMNNAGSVLMVKFNLDETISRIKKNQLNVLICIPYLAKKILDSGKFKGSFLKNLIATYCGADKTPTYIIDEYNSLMDEYNSKGYLLEGYGLTETVTVTFVNTHKDYKKGSVGKPLLGTKLKIVSDDDYETDIGSEKTGKILISSPALCVGYLNGECPFYIDKTGEKWLITGDIGYHDDDGFLYFSNRENDVYKIAGYNVFPSLIEEEATKVDGINFACCLYISDEKEPYLHLFVEAKENINLSEVSNKLDKQLADNLIKYSYPKKITFVSRMPRTDIGKIDKKKLLEEHR